MRAIRMLAAITPPWPAVVLGIITMAALVVSPAKAETYELLQTFDDPTVTTGDYFGRSVAIDGDNVLIGARLDDTNGTDVGQAHLFDAATGNLLQTFNDPTVTGADFFGFSVALDGDNVLIGAHGDSTNGLLVGQAHLFLIPEPASAMLLMMGSVLLVRRRRRRNRGR